MPVGAAPSRGEQAGLSSAPLGLPAKPSVAAAASAGPDSPRNPLARSATAPISPPGSSLAKPLTAPPAPAPAPGGGEKPSVVTLPRDNPDAAPAAAPAPAIAPPVRQDRATEPARTAVPASGVSQPPAPAAPDEAELARRRLAALREEMAGYEREAEKLRALLRRALGLDPAAESMPEEPEAAESGVRQGDR